MKTDPKQHDYVCESGASRNYEPWRDIEHAEKILKARSQLEDEDAMKRVEKKGFNSKREMEVMDALNEVKMLLSLIFAFQISVRMSKITSSFSIHLTEC